MEKEIWYDVIKDEKMYDWVEVSDLGRARYKGTNDICILHDNGNGYLAVYCRIDKKTVLRYIHRLVAQVFHDNPKNLPQVGHKDDDKSNNHPDNLYWCSGSRNIRDAHRTGGMKKRSQHGSTKWYGPEIVKEAYCRVVFKGDKITPTASDYDMPRTTLSSIINKRAWSHLTDKLDEEFS